MVPFDWPYDFLLVFHCKYVSILHRLRDIITYFPKFKRSRDSEHTPFGSNKYIMHALVLWSA